MIVRTRPCIMCGLRAMVVVDQGRYEEWQAGGVDIQVAMPDLSDDERELLLTGTHAQCWETLWA